MNAVLLDSHPNDAKHTNTLYFEYEGGYVIYLTEQGKEIVAGLFDEIAANLLVSHPPCGNTVVVWDGSIKQTVFGIQFYAGPERTCPFVIGAGLIASIRQLDGEPIWLNKLQ